MATKPLNSFKIPLQTFYFGWKINYFRRAQILFFIFELLISLMQFNLLIAMMTRTYEMIYATQKEWKRQVGPPGDGESKFPKIDPFSVGPSDPDDVNAFGPENPNMIIQSNSANFPSTQRTD